MRAIVQRVSMAQVTVEGKICASIDRGLLVFLGISNADNEKDLDWMVKKIVGLRIFEDNEGKMNLSIKNTGGNILVVSQFTLYANVQKGRRPSFIEAARPENAEPLYLKFCDLISGEKIEVERGVFGAKMDVKLINDGPVTLLVEKTTTNIRK